MSMYIYANLPKSYGKFNQIREDNYPFNRLFTEYLKSLFRLGEAEGMDIFALLGHVENELMGFDRLPDMPECDSYEKLNFRYPVKDDLVSRYYKDQEITNKMITQLIIRTTIRLSEVYGTSLLRLVTLISGIGEEGTVVTKRESSRVSPAAKVAITEPSRTVEPDKEQIEDPKEQSEGQSRQDLLDRIDELTKKGSQLVEQTTKRDEHQDTAAKEDDESDEEDGSGKIVQTNPHLKNFI